MQSKSAPQVFILVINDPSSDGYGHQVLGVYTTEEKALTQRNQYDKSLSMWMSIDIYDVE